MIVFCESTGWLGSSAALVWTTHVQAALGLGLALPGTTQLFSTCLPRPSASYCGYVLVVPAGVQERRQHANAFLSLCLCQVRYNALGQSKSHPQAQRQFRKAQSTRVIGVKEKWQDGVDIVKRAI